MARRSDHLYPESSEVPTDGRQYVYVGLAGIASAGAYLTKGERPPEDFVYLFGNRHCKFGNVSIDNEVTPVLGGQFMVW
jgi:hypothetical protein